MLFQKSIIPSLCSLWLNNIILLRPDKSGTRNDPLTLEIASQVRFTVIPTKMLSHKSFMAVDSCLHGNDNSELLTTYETTSMYYWVIQLSHQFICKPSSIISILLTLFLTLLAALAKQLKEHYPSTTSPRLSLEMLSHREYFPCQ